MGQLFGNLATLLGGVAGILIGVFIIGIVVAVGLLPFVFMARHELKEPGEGPDQGRDQTIEPARRDNEGRAINRRSPRRPARV